MNYKLQKLRTMMDVGENEFGFEEWTPKPGTIITYQHYDNMPEHIIGHIDVYDTMPDHPVIILARTGVGYSNVHVTEYGRIGTKFRVYTSPQVID